MENVSGIYTYISILNYSCFAIGRSSGNDVPRSC